MKNTLHKALCGLLITFSFQAGAYTFHPLHFSGDFAFHTTPLATTALNPAMLQASRRIGHPLVDSSTRQMLVVNNQTFSFTIKYARAALAAGNFAGQKLSLRHEVIYRATACERKGTWSSIADSKYFNSNYKNLIGLKHSKLAVKIPETKDCTILYARVVC